jgi:hypothetical protein
MTPFAVTQRAARLAPELDRIHFERYGVELPPVTTADVLVALWRSGLTLDADLHSPSRVLAALNRLGVSPTGPRA